MNSLYFKIVDFVSLAKKLEYCVKVKYDYEGESIFRGKIEKVIPFRGVIKFDQVEYEFYFHGLGIDFKSDERKIHYNHYAGKEGLGVYFTLKALFEDHNFIATKKVKDEFDDLIRKNIIKEWMPEMSQGNVFYLV